MLTAGWASAIGSHACFSHPPPWGSRKLAAPTVAAAAPSLPICSRTQIGVGVRSLPRLPAAASVGATPPPRPGGHWEAQCGGHKRPGWPRTFLSLTVLCAMGTAPAIEACRLRASSHP